MAPSFELQGLSYTDLTDGRGSIARLLRLVNRAKRRFPTCNQRPRERARAPYVEPGPPAHRSSLTPPCWMSRRASRGRRNADPLDEQRRQMDGIAVWERDLGHFFGRHFLVDDPREVLLGVSAPSSPHERRDDEPGRARASPRAVRQPARAPPRASGTIPRELVAGSASPGRILFGRLAQRRCSCPWTTPSPSRPTLSRSDVVRATCGSRP